MLPESPGHYRDVDEGDYTVMVDICVRVPSRAPPIGVESFGNYVYVQDVDVPPLFMSPVSFVDSSALTDGAHIESADPSM